MNRPSHLPIVLCLTWCRLCLCLEAQAQFLFPETAHEPEMIDKTAALIREAILDPEIIIITAQSRMDGTRRLQQKNPPKTFWNICWTLRLHRICVGEILTSPLPLADIIFVATPYDPEAPSSFATVDRAVYTIGPSVKPDKEMERNFPRDADVSLNYQPTFRPDNQMWLLFLRPGKIISPKPVEDSADEIAKMDAEELESFRASKFIVENYQKLKPEEVFKELKVDYLLNSKGWFRLYHGNAAFLADIPELKLDKIQQSPATERLHEAMLKSISERPNPDAVTLSGEFVDDLKWLIQQVKTGELKRGKVPKDSAEKVKSVHAKQILRQLQGPDAAETATRMKETWFPFTFDGRMSDESGPVFVIGRVDLKNKHEVKLNQEIKDSKNPGWRVVNFEQKHEPLNLGRVVMSPVSFKDVSELTLSNGKETVVLLRGQPKKMPAK